MSGGSDCQLPVSNSRISRVSVSRWRITPIASSRAKEMCSGGGLGSGGDVAQNITDIIVLRLTAQRQHRQITTFRWIELPTLFSLRYGHYQPRVVLVRAFRA